jgi:hypothetical protein
MGLRRTRIDALVQPIFRPASRRQPSDCPPSVFRRDAGLKMLCIVVLHYRAELQPKNVSLQIQRPVCSGLRKKAQNIGHIAPHFTSAYLA